MSHIVVIGAGQAGSSLVAKLRKDGFDGEITLIGAEDRAALSAPAAVQGISAGRDGAGTALSAACRASIRGQQRSRCGWASVSPVSMRRPRP